MAELKPCPFCGGEATLENKYLWSSVGWGKSYTSFHVVCKRCGTSGASFNTVDHGDRAKRKAVEAWDAITQRYYDVDYDEIHPFFKE